MRRSSKRPVLLYTALEPVRPFHDTAWMTVAEDGSEAVLMLTRDLSQPNTDDPLVRLRGLQADCDYRIVETGETYGGDELMHSGLAIRLPQRDAASVSLTLKRL